MSPSPSARFFTRFACFITILALVQLACGAPQPTAAPPTPAAQTGSDDDPAPTGAAESAAATAAPTGQPEPTAVPLPDADHDAVADEIDVCLNTADPGQSDLDADGLGDVCDPDLDGDEVTNAADTCPFNAAQGCDAGESLIVTVTNSALIADPAASAIHSLQLIGFANPEPGLPALLNLSVSPNGDAPLWTEGVGAALQVQFHALRAAPGFPSQDGVTITGGRLSLTCPAAHAGECEGSLALDLACGNAPCAQPPACPPADAACAWGAAARTPVWGAYDAATNQILASAGLPLLLPDALTMQYEVAVMPAGAARSLFSTAPGVNGLPFVVADGADDCDFNPDCAPGADIQSASLLPVLVEGRPFLAIDFEMFEPVPNNALSIGLVLLVEDPAGELMFHGYMRSLAADGTVTSASNRKAWLNGAWRQNVGAMPDDLTWDVAGSQAQLRLPLQLTDGRVLWVISLGTGRTGDFNSDYVYNWTDFTQLPAPLAVTAWAGGADLPLVGFTQHRMLADPIHAFTFFEFAGDTQGATRGVRRGSPALIARAQPPTPHCGTLSGQELPLIRDLNGWGFGYAVPYSAACQGTTIASNGVRYLLRDFWKEGEALLPVAPAAPPVAVAPARAAGLLSLRSLDLSISLTDIEISPPSKLLMLDGYKDYHNVRLKLTVTNSGPSVAYPLLNFLEPINEGNRTGLSTGQRLLELFSLNVTDVTGSIPEAVKWNGDEDDEFEGLPLGPVGPNETVELEVDLIVFGDRRLRFEVFDFRAGELNIANNHADAEILPRFDVAPQPDTPVELEVTLEGAAEPVGMNQYTTVKVKVKNTGQTPSLGTGLVFSTDTLRGGFAGSVVDYQVGDGAAVDPLAIDSFATPLGDLQPGQEVVVEVVVRMFSGEPMQATVTGANSAQQVTLQQAELSVPLAQ